MDRTFPFFCKEDKGPRPWTIGIDLGAGGGLLVGCWVKTVTVIQQLGWTATEPWTTMITVRTVVYGVHPKRCTPYHLNTTPQGCNHVVYMFTCSGVQFYLWVKTFIRYCISIGYKKWNKDSRVYKRKTNDIKTTTHVQNQDVQSLSIFFVVVTASLTFLGIGCSSLIPKMYRWIKIQGEYAPLEYDILKT